jgi:predicted nucleic acid-binding protein
VESRTALWQRILTASSMENRQALKIFIDTWGWLALRDSREDRHEEIKDRCLDLRGRGYSFYTSDYVLDETFTLLFRRLRFEEARRSLDVMDMAIEEGYLRLERITAERFEKAKSLRKRFQDKPRISFTDFTSMVVMAELGITDILTEDEHFTQVGMGFQRIP